MPGVVENATIINAPPSAVWRALTELNLMTRWSAESELQVKVVTDWKVGSPIVVKGRHNNAAFENKGTVLEFQPNSTLRYSHLSSIARLPDEPENYTIIEFRLTPVEANTTSLNVTASNFPSEAIFKHWQFYWRVTIEVLKRFVEGTGPTS